jgi:hypothetical protein
VGGSDFAALTLTSCGGQAKPQNAPATHEIGKIRKEDRKSTHQLADGEHLEHPQLLVVAMPRPKVDGSPRPGGRVRPRKGVPQQPRFRQRDGIRGLSIKGMTRRWWRLASTHPAVSPRSTSFFSAATSESSRAWCEGGDTPWYQEAALSRSTLPV